MSAADTDVIVIGAGVAGLSCASELVQAGHRVAVWAAAPPRQTTSVIAAAFWYPYLVEPLARVGPWSAIGYERFARIAADLSVGPRAGVYMREAIEIFAEPVPDPPWSRYVDMFRHAQPDELPPGYRHGIVFHAPVIEMARYLPWLAAEVARLGVEISIRRLDSLAPALAAAPIVVNTSGLGARELVGDAGVYPVRGQIVRQTRERIDRVIIDEHSPEGIRYIIPRGTDVVVGGVSERDDEDLRTRPEQTAAILERCTKLEPALASTRTLGVSVGLRPCRAEVRLELESLGDRLVVHNYGHGGAGVTLSWGCAEEVVRLITARRAGA
jgi:D-amino-acid oxidase